MAPTGLQLRTSSDRVRTVVAAVAEDATRVFGARSRALYAIGSLARGGFSEAVSDLDLGVVLRGRLEPADASRIDGIARRGAACDPALPNAVSLFWGSIESLNGLVGGGRFPPFDRLDLIDHGLLLSGSDVRARLVRPGSQEVVVAGARFGLSALATEERLAELRDVDRLLRRGPVAVTKTVLFPARFLYVEHTGHVAGNPEAARSYGDRFRGPDADLVSAALSWRSHPLPPAPEGRALLAAGLVPLYRRFLNVYVARLEADGERELASSLAAWRDELRA